MFTGAILAKNDALNFVARESKRDEKGNKQTKNEATAIASITNVSVVMSSVKVFVLAANVHIDLLYGMCLIITDTQTYSTY